ncbi:MAG: threonine aldolase [Verrucomicrobia bacterium]|nr:threonine aldolase [Verrucomicrobiota bacterium]
MSTPSRHFASDNNAGLVPEVWAALQEANVGHAPAYGDDPWTAQAVAEFRRVFEHDALEVCFVFNGTAANSLALAALTDSMHGVLCHEFSHVMTDECNAPGFFRHGLMLLPVGGAFGKIDPAALPRRVAGLRSVHAPEAKVLSLTQATELGTVYRPDEIAELAAVARSLELRVHMDGARFANAVAAAGCAPADLTWRAGVEVLSFGGTKGGMLAGEAVVFFEPALAANFRRRMKQSGQLASKMRFLSAPWAGFLRDDAWLRHARHANAMADRLAAGVYAVPGAALAHAPEANAVFARLPAGVAEKLWTQGWRFYDDVGPAGAVRLMCAWDTTAADVDAFVADLARAAE